jgi:hypothetical protein
MSGQIKRPRTENTENQDGAGNWGQCPSSGPRAVISSCSLLTSHVLPVLQTRLGRKFVGESELLTLLVASRPRPESPSAECARFKSRRGAQPPSHSAGIADNPKATLGASRPAVGEAEVEIANSQGAAESRQDLYRVAARSGRRGEATRGGGRARARVCVCACVDALLSLRAFLTYLCLARRVRVPLQALCARSPPEQNKQTKRSGVSGRLLPAGQ